MAFLAELLRIISYKLAEKLITPLISGYSTPQRSESIISPDSQRFSLDPLSSLLPRVPIYKSNKKQNIKYLPHKNDPP
jgi:hypothetical protein